MRLALVSDSHIPARATSIPETFSELIRGANHVIHAGDFESAEVVDEFEGLADALTAVHGNADPADIGLPAVADVTIDDITFVVTHGTLNLPEAAVYGHDGTVLTGEDWVKAIADTARVRTRAWDGDGVVGIGGHTHRVEDTVYEGVRVLNPGSVTGADPADGPTMMTVDVADGEIDVTLHELE